MHDWAYIEIIGRICKDIIIEEVSPNVKYGVMDVATEIDTKASENVRPIVVFKVFIRDPYLLEIYGHVLKKDTGVWLKGELSFLIEPPSNVQEAYKINSPSLITNVWADILSPVELKGSVNKQKLKPGKNVPHLKGKQGLKGSYLLKRPTVKANQP